MLHNYLLKTKRLFFLGCIYSLLFSACRPSVDLPQVMELTILDKRNIAERIFEMIDSDENYQILNQTEYADAYAYLDNSIDFLTDSELLLHRTDYNWKVYILDEEGTNAFATPGGYIYFDKGLLNKIESESAFMHLLAHEISYVDKGLISQKLQDNYGLQILLDLALGSTVETAEELLGTLYNEAFDTSTVEQADDFMLELACEKGYDADSLKWFLQYNSTITWLDVHATENLEQRLLFIRDYECATLDSMNVSTNAYSDFLDDL